MAVLWVGLLCGGCAGGGAAGTVAGGRADEAVDIDRFATGRELIGGKVRPASGEKWRRGDEVLLGVAMDTQRGSGEWYVRVTAERLIPLEEARATVRMQEPESGRLAHFLFELVEVRVELFDGNAQLISQNTAHVPEICLNRGGLFEFTELLKIGQDGHRTWPAGDAESDERFELAAAGMMSLMRIPDFLQGDQGMDQLIWRIIDRPGLLSVLGNRGVNLALEYVEGAEVRPEESAIFTPAYRAPLAVVLNGRPALNCEMLVMQAVPPYGLVNGLLALDAVHPRDPQRRLAVRLLGAQRGDP